MKGKILRKIIAVSLSAMMIVGTGFTSVGQLVGTDVSVGATEIYGDFEYEIKDDDTIIIKQYNGRNEEVTIPETIDGKIVNDIGWTAFGGWTGVRVLNISKNISYLSNMIFSNCPNMTDINIDEDNPVYSSYNGALFTKEYKEMLICPYGKSGAYTIPADTETISSEAFLKCSKLTDILVDKNNSVYSSADGVLFTKDMKKILRVPAGRSGKYIIPSSVSVIGTLAFSRCNHLTAVDIPSTVTEIEQSAFSRCESLESIVIPDGVTSIKNNMFINCIKLKSVKLSNNVTEIEKYAFYSCWELEDFTMPEKVSKIGNAAFESCQKLKTIKLYEGLEAIEDNTFFGCNSLTNVEIPNTVKSIGFYSFRDCRKLESITIPKSVVSIDKTTFYHCDALTVYGQKQSFAEQYANENSIPFKELKDLANNSILDKNEIVLGTTVTVNAKADGGTGNCTYAVLYKKKAEKKWTVKQNYSTNNTIIIKPAKATDYDVCVKVKDSTGNIVKKFFDVKVNAKLVNTSSISATTIKKGNTVTLKGSASGGMGSYKYAALYKKCYEKKWTVRQNYKDNSDIIVRPYTNTDYDICIKVQDENGTIAKKYFNVTVK